LSDVTRAAGPGVPERLGSTAGVPQLRASSLREAMATTGRFRFSALLASVLIGLRGALVVVRVGGARVPMLLPALDPVAPPRAPLPLLAAVVFVGGLVVAVPLSRPVRLVQIILDQRRLLGQIHRRLRRFEDERESERTHRMWGPGRHPGGPA